MSIASSPIGAPRDMKRTRPYSLTDVLLNEFRAEGANTMRIRLRDGAGLWLESDHRPTLHMVIEGELPITLVDGSVQRLVAGDCASNFYGERQLLGDPQAPDEFVVPPWRAIGMPDQVVDLTIGEDADADRFTAVVMTFVLTVPALGSRAFANRAVPNLMILPASANGGTLPLGIDARQLMAMLDGPGGNALATQFGAWLMTLVEREIALKVVWNKEIRSVRTPNSSQISAILREMRAWPSKPWTVDMMARSVGLSRSTFTAAFTAATGLAPMSFLTRERMERAARLLGSEVLSIQQVGQLVGYQIENSFARAFKRHWGMPPAIYQQDYARVFPRDEDAQPES